MMTLSLEIVSSTISLIVLEIILGVDNLVFLNMLTEKLPVLQRKSAARFGLFFAWLNRLILLCSAGWLIRFTHPILSFSDYAFSPRDFFVMIGGIFLIMKATQEIHHEITKTKTRKKRVLNSADLFRRVVIQIACMDVIFSFDSVFTAVGLTPHFTVMVIAMTVAILVMVYASEPIGHFTAKNPTVGMLALSFLILIGTLLVADGFGVHLPRAYVYFAMLFALGVELLNILKRGRLQRRKRQC